MSAESKRARAERRAQEREVPAHPGEAGESVRVVALVADGGGYRVVVAEMPVDLLEAHAVRVSEPEVLTMQLPLAAEALEERARGFDDPGSAARSTCSTCGRTSLVRHPSKPVRLCGACGARETVSA